MFATSPSTLMDSTTMGGPPKAAPPLLWRRPKAASIMVDGGGANEGAPPFVVEAAEGRLHYGGWRAGKHSKHICKYVSNIC